MKVRTFIIKRLIEIILVFFYGYFLYEVIHLSLGTFRRENLSLNEPNLLQNVGQDLVMTGVMSLIFLLDSLPLLFPLLMIRSVVGKPDKPEMKILICIWSLVFFFIWIAATPLFLLHFLKTSNVMVSEELLRQILRFSLFCGGVLFFWFIGILYPYKILRRAKKQAENAPVG